LAEGPCRHRWTATSLKATLANPRLWARADHRAAELRLRNGQPDLDKIGVIYESEWNFVGSGHREGETLWAEATREQVRIARTIRERKSTAHNRQN
jgi:hypothetical protein